MNSKMRTAFIMQIHKNPDQVNQFIQQLVVDDQADVYVHIDQRYFHEYQGRILKNPNVKVITNSIICEWGDISQIDTTLLLLREVIASKKSYDFVCLRSGQDLLVKNGLKSFLIENKNKVFLNNLKASQDQLAVMLMNWPKITRKRYTTPHPARILRRTLQDLYKKGIYLFPNKNYWPKDYSFYKGSQWFTIPINVVNYIIDFVNNNEWYYQFFKNTYTPDEWFFHTLIMNSPFKFDVENNHLFFYRWGNTFSDRSSPQYLTKDDINLIEKSDTFFARKFDVNIDPSVIEYFVNKVHFGKNVECQIKEVNDHIIHI
ncbi:glycosyl transferase [Heyndrickxia sporothermodurans]|nr:glycosyl transferase [Heyndrickxia sporothermodurans]